MGMIVSRIAGRSTRRWTPDKMLSKISNDIPMQLTSSLSSVRIAERTASAYTCAFSGMMVEVVV